METIEIHEGEYTLSTDRSRLDINAIHDYLSRESYWSQNIPFDIVEQSVENSIPFGVYHGQQQIGFARVITDHALFGYLADVYILTPHRGKGLSKLLMRTIMDHPVIKGLRRLLLITSDAHGLYRQFGFTEIPNPEKYMQVHIADLYTKKE
ncbi:GNAT family N-acetyltransferase [Chitinophaga polysaccharea]|uniref:GNAT family N-acetyltransferase n=1 Tax=Chitinophaga TaxID=79328 RepID=UPI00145512CC|nr:MULTISPECIES: GNAT family N-acetyltransferase [Chitinophaga]NLR57298.1 GNAT family N-acetyltransferase [Chitinophaga polysaccharea]NLU91584.1 GNAT family N-acetyltransferase [Chitinophaga sp. Ak27]